MKARESREPGLALRVLEGREKGQDSSRNKPGPVVVLEVNQFNKFFDPGGE